MIGKTHIVTVSGRIIDFADPDPFQIALSDIAFALSKEQRFGNHLPRDWSVAQHSLLVASMVRPEYRLGALLHDAHEAYTGDIPTPVKLLLGSRHANTGIYLIQERLDHAIHVGLGIRPGGLGQAARFEIKAADNLALLIEAKGLSGTHGHFDYGPLEDSGFDIESAQQYFGRLCNMSTQEVAELFCAKFLEMRGSNEAQ